MKSTVRVSFALLAALLICLISLAACDGSESEPPVVTSKPTDATEPSTPTDSEEIPTEKPTEAHVHEFGDWEIIIEPDCTENGEKKRECGCGEIELEEIAAKGHTEAIYEAIEPTCTKEGATEGKYCTICNEVLIYQQVIEAKGHSFGDWSVVIEPTCTENGEQMRECPCGTVESSPIPASEHEVKVLPAVAPTCTETGLTEGSVCSKCDEVFVEQKIVKTIPHSQGEWIIETEATKTEDGFRYARCSKCDALLAEEVLHATGSLGLKYSRIDYKDEYTVSGIGTCNDADIIIPEYYNGMPVTAISPLVFADKSSIRSISIPASINMIEEWAFKNCTGLEAVYITDLAAWCETEFESNPLALANALYLNGELLTELKVPHGVEMIATNAFSQYTRLTSVSIPSSVKAIGNNAFYGCTNIERIELSEGLNTIAGSAFSNCTSLEAIALPNSVESVGRYAFSQCSSLESVKLSENMKTLAEGLFHYCTRLVRIVIPESVETLNSNVFGYCYNLASVIDPNGVTDNGSNAFNLCYKLVEKVASISESRVTESDDGLVFFDDGTRCYLVGYVGTDNTITLPEKYNGNTYDIREYAFFFNENIVRVVIGEGTTVVGRSAFENCSNLLEAVVSDSVTTIEDAAFSGCSNMLSITIGSKLSSFGFNAFDGCNFLVEIYNRSEMKITTEDHPSNNGGLTSNALNVYTPIDGSKKLWCSDDGFIFYEGEPYCYVMKYIGEKSEIVFPKSCNGKKYRIYDNAFYERTDIESVSFSDGVEYIGSWAFYGCTGIESLSLPGTMTDIGSGAFQNCNELKKVVLENGFLNISRYLFYGCTSLSSIEIPDTVIWVGDDAFTNTAYYNDGSNWENSILYAGKYLLDSNVGVSGVCKIKDGTRVIASLAFDNRSGITELVLPDTLDSIGSWAFRHCRGIKEIVIPDGIERISSEAFLGCTGVEKISLPFVGPNREPYTDGKYSFGYIFGTVPTSLKTVTLTGDSIPEKAFYKCGSITSILLSGKPTTIGKNAFAQCGIEGIIIPASVTEIGSGAFSGCTSLKNMVIPKGVVEISSSAFSGCSALEEIDIPDSVKSIGSYAFSNCQQLKSIRLPEGVASVGDCAFRSCTTLTDVTLHDSITSMGEDVFDYTAYYNNEVNWENGLLYIGNHLVASKLKSLGTNLNTLTIRAGTKTIASSVFSETGNIKSIVIPNSVVYIGKYALLSCYNITSITFEGTKSEWAEITFGESWSLGVHTNEVICSDGRVKIV